MASAEGRPQRGSPGASYSSSSGSTGIAPAGRAASWPAMVSTTLTAQPEELTPQLCVGVVVAAPVAGAGAGLDLADAAHLRTQMHRLQVHRDPVRGQDALQRVGELLPDPLLHREPAG